MEKVTCVNLFTRMTFIRVHAFHPASSKTQGLLVGIMRYFQASDNFGAKVYFKGQRAPGHFFLPNEF